MPDPVATPDPPAPALTPQGGPEDPLGFEPIGFGEPEPEPTPAPDPDPAIVTPEPSPDPQNVDPQPPADDIPPVDDPFAEIEPDPEPQPPSPEPSATPEPEATPKDMREQIIAANARAKEADARAEEAQKRVEAAEAKIKEIEDQAALLEQAAAATNPSTHPDVQAIVGPMNEEWDNFAMAMGPAGDKLQSESQQLFQGWQDVMKSHGTDDYATKYNGFLDTIKEGYPDENPRSIIAMVNKAVGVMSQAQKKMEEIQKNGSQQSYEASLQRFNTLKAGYDAEEKNFFEPDAAQAENPYNAKNIIKRMADSQPNIQKAMDGVRAFSRKAILPPAPVNQEDLAGLPEAEAQAQVAEANKSHQEAALQRDRIFPAALMALRILPLLARENDKLKGIAERVASSGPPPPDPSQDPPRDSDEAPEGPLDPAKFVPEVNPELGR